MLDAVWAAGCRYFDTAPLYGLGLSETRLNGFLRPKPRGSYLISTKVTFTGLGGGQEWLQFGFEKAAWSATCSAKFFFGGTGIARTR